MTTTNYNKDDIVILWGRNITARIVEILDAYFLKVRLPYGQVVTISTADLEE